MTRKTQQDGEMTWANFSKVTNNQSQALQQELFSQNLVFYFELKILARSLEQY